VSVILQNKPNQPTTMEKETLREELMQASELEAARLLNELMRNCVRQG
jgi:hypothetical protein